MNLLDLLYLLDLPLEFPRLRRQAL